MDFKRMPSLEYHAAVQISIAILYNPRVLNIAFRSKSHFPEVLNEVCDILDDLRLPTNCCRKIKIIVMNMIQELKKWKSCHSKITIPSEMLATYLCWTSLGTIDNLKTARKLLNEFNLSIKNRFRLACKYCFFSDATILWEDILKGKKISCKDSILDSWIHHASNQPTFMMPYNGIKHQVEDYKSVESFISNVDDYLNKCSVYDLRFILDHKMPSERNAILRFLALKTNVALDTRFFCFQQVDEVTQIESLEKFPVEIFKCILTWPYQNFVLDLADRIWDHIRPEDFYQMVFAIISNLRNNFFWKNFELVEILQQLWHRSPADFKDCASNSTIHQPLNILLNCRNPESLNPNKLEEAFKTNMRQCLILIQRYRSQFI